VSDEHDTAADAFQGTDRSGRRPAQGPAWRRMLAEGVLILGSVYLAIYLEGVSQERGRVENARAALAQLRVELEEDRRDLDEILAEQRVLASTYVDVGRWLSNPDAMPFDSVQRALDFLGFSNRTMFPRKGAWTTMLAEGHLSALDDPDLVARLGTFYGRINERIEYNGRDYDFSLNQIMRESVPAAWDHDRERPTGDPEPLRVLRSQLRFLQLAWNTFYIDLLGQYERELDALIEAVSAYLGDEGRAGVGGPS
jgi:hypothetical protein